MGTMLFPNNNFISFGFYRHVRFALLTRKTWPLVVVTRRAVIVANLLNYAPSAAVKSRPESSSTEVDLHRCSFIDSIALNFFSFLMQGS
ncbi:hypothetical protein SASPL_118285 [Salvia splendens]|uniref:Uncharacterized protein n=1 Tax=Salvia splendens TaxID=180675 RepID=A0A8X8Y1C6_SALSN|nr:hypothetical protein SASPL_118285 [Salvia splendens]